MCPKIAIYENYGASTFEVKGGHPHTVTSSI